MNKAHFDLIMEKCAFPQGAVDELSEYVLKIKNEFESEFDAFVKLYFENGCDSRLIGENADEFADRVGIPVYSLWMLTVIEASFIAKPEFEKRGISGQIYFDTFSDLVCKANECKACYDVWGTFVAHWYRRFFNYNIVKLGRMEYENSEYEFDTPYMSHGITVEKGTPVKKLHIPSSSEPFDSETRLDSYKKAYEFFKSEHNGDPMVFACNSWLLYPDYVDEFPCGTNISDFKNEFDIINRTDKESFDDCWRVFGVEYTGDISVLPEKTSMQRVFKKRIADGKTFGSGYGIFIFDGQNIINNKE